MIIVDKELSVKAHQWLQVIPWAGCDLQRDVTYHSCSFMCLWICFPGYGMIVRNK